MTRFITSDAPQGSDEWKAARAGKATGSRARDILAKIKDGEAAARRDYRAQLVAERLTGRPQERGTITPEMKWGTEKEPLARMTYEERTANLVRECGFVYLPDLAAGCSVDGFVAPNGLIEIKCPKTATHLDYLLAGVMPATHEPQVTHNLWITGADWCDFVSFDPRLPEALQFFTVRVLRDETRIKAHETEVRDFLLGVDASTERLQKFLREAQ